MGFTPFIAKLPLRDMELQEKEVQKDKIYEKSVSNDPSGERFPFILDLKPWVLEVKEKHSMWWKF